MFPDGIKKPTWQTEVKTPSVSVEAPFLPSLHEGIHELANKLEVFDVGLGLQSVIINVCK